MFARECNKEPKTWLSCRWKFFYIRILAFACIYILELLVRDEGDNSKLGLANIEFFAV